MLFFAIHGFNGLEAAVVIVADVDGGTEAKLPYTAFSRAKQLLYVMHTPDDPRAGGAVEAGELGGSSAPVESQRIDQRVPISAARL